VFIADSWPADLSDDETLARLLALNLERAKELRADCVSFRPASSQSSTATELRSGY